MLQLLACSQNFMLHHMIRYKWNPIFILSYILLPQIYITENLSFSYPEHLIHHLIILNLSFLSFYLLSHIYDSVEEDENTVEGAGLFLRPCRDCIERIIWDPILDIKDFSFIYQDR